MKYLIVTIILTASFFSNAQQAYWIERNNFIDYRSDLMSFNDFNAQFVGLGHRDLAEPIDSCMTDLWEYDAENDEWIQRADFPGAPRYHAVAVKVDGGCLVGLGQDCDGNYYSDLWRYDISDDTWSPVNDFPSARAGTVGFKHSDISVIGSGKNETQYFGDFYKYDAANDAWIQIASIPKNPRAFAMTFPMKQSVFVCGGENDAKSFKSVYKLNFPALTWTHIQDMPTGISRGFGFSKRKKNGWIVGGGKWKNSVFMPSDTVYRFGDNWKPFGLFPDGPIRSGFIVLRDDDQIYIGAGSQDSSKAFDPANYNKVWKFSGTIEKEEDAETEPEVEGGITVFSNGSGMIEIVFSKPVNAETRVDITDLSGKIVQTEILDEEVPSFQFKLERPGGMYICSIVSVGRIVYSCKILKLN